MAEAYNDWSFLNNQKQNIQKFKSFNKQNARNLDNVKLFQLNGGTYIAKKLWDDNQLESQTLVAKNEQLKEKYQLRIKQNLVKESQIYKAQQEQEQYENLADNFQLEKIEIDPKEANYALISNRNNIRGMLDVNSNQFLKVFVPVKTKKRKNASLERNATEQKTNKLINLKSAQIFQLNSEKKFQRNIIPGEKKFQESMMLINEYQQNNRPIVSQIKSVIKPTQTQVILQNRILKIPGGLTNQFVHKKSALDSYSQPSEVQDDRKIYAQSGPAHKVPFKASPVNRVDPNFYYKDRSSLDLEKEQNINKRSVLNHENFYDQSHESQNQNQSSLSPNNQQQTSFPQLVNVGQQLSNYENISRDRQFGVKSKVDLLNSKNGTIEQNEFDVDIRKKTLNIFDEKFDITQRRKQKEVNFLDGYQFMKAPTKSQDLIGYGAKQKSKKKQKKLDNFLKQGILRKTNLSEYQFEHNNSAHINSNDEFERSYDPNKEPKPSHTANIETPLIINIQTNPSKSRFENQSIDQNTIDNGFDRKKLYDAEMFKLTKRPSKLQKNGTILAPLTRNKSQDEMNELEKYTNKPLKVSKGAQTNLKGFDAIHIQKKSIPWKPSGKVNEDELRKKSLSPPVQRSLENSPSLFKQKQAYNKKVFKNKKSKLVEISTQTDNEMQVFEQNQPNDYELKHLPDISQQKNIFESKPISKEDRQKVSKSLQLGDRKQSKKQRTDSSNGRDDLCDYCRENGYSNKCEFGCANQSNNKKQHKWVKLINQEKQLYVPVNPSQEYPQNDELTEDQYQIKQQESGKKYKKKHRNINHKSSNIEISAHSSKNNISGLNLNKSQSVVSILKEKNENKISHNLLDARSRSSQSQQPPDDYQPTIMQSRQSDTLERRLSSQPIQYQKTTTPDVPSVQYESVNNHQNKNNSQPKNETTPISSKHFETKSHEKQSAASQRKTLAYQTTNNKKRNSDLRKMISSNSSSRDKSFDKTLPKAIHQSDQEKIWFTKSQQDQLKSSTKNSEKKSYHSQKKTKSIREFGTDPINFDLEQIIDKQESRKDRSPRYLSPNKSEKRRDLSDSPRKSKISDWARSILYKMIESQKGTMFKDNDWNQFNLQKMQIFTEDEAQYNYSILLRIATEHDDIYDKGQLEILSDKASNTIHVLCEHMLLSKNFARHFQSSDQPFEEDPNLWNSLKKNTISLNQLYKTLNIDTVIKLLLRVKMLYNTYTDVKQILCLIYHQQKMFEPVSGPIPDLINKIQSKKQLSQKEEKELIKAMQILEKLSRRIQQLKLDHKLFRNFEFNGNNFQEQLLDEAEIIYEVILDCNGQSLSRFTVPSLDQNEQLVFKKPATGYQSKRQSLNQKLVKKQFDDEEKNKIENNLQIFTQKSQPNENLGNQKNESSHFGSKNSNKEIINQQDADEELKFIPLANRGQEITFQSSGENSKQVSDRIKNKETYMNVEGGNEIINIQNQDKELYSDLQIEHASQKYQTQINQQNMTLRSNEQLLNQKDNKFQNKIPLYISFSTEQINQSEPNKLNSLKSSQIPTISKYQSPIIEQTFHLNQSQNEIDRQSNTQSNDTVQNETLPKLKYSEEISQQKWNVTDLKAEKLQEFLFEKPSKSVSTVLTERYNKKKDIQQELGKQNQKMSQLKFIENYEIISRGTSSRETVEQKELGKFYELNQFKNSNQSPTTTKNMIQ